MMDKVKDEDKGHGVNIYVLFDETNSKLMDMGISRLLYRSLWKAIIRFLFGGQKISDHHHRFENAKLYDDAVE